MESLNKYDVKVLSKKEFHVCMTIVQHKRYVNCQVAWKENLGQ